MINIRLPDSLGCTVASTSVLQSLIKCELFDDIHVFTKHFELVSHLQGINLHPPVDNTFLHVDLRKYTSRRPHNNRPYRASYLHMLEMAEESLAVKLPIILPNIPTHESDACFAKEIISTFSKPLIWIQSKTTTDNRNWNYKRWLTLIKNLSNNFDFIDLSNVNYSLLQSLAITKYSFAGICLDSFLVHGSAAVGAENVIVLAGSSRGECITYPGQSLIYEESECIAQPCGMHGYYSGCKKEHEQMFLDCDCINTDKFACMNKIDITQVENLIKNFKTSSNNAILNYEIKYATP
ncbi:hypothetical protein [Buttiauxella sp.]|uniref:hypothetical protein n=1 Tax=Buttiauxella sp. TaxID=1972222 RepID=UPI003C70724E